MQVTGTIVKIKPTETIPSKTGGKDFVKREFWLQLADEKYPQTIPFEFVGGISLGCYFLSSLPFFPKSALYVINNLSK